MISSIQASDENCKRLATAQAMCEAARVNMDYVEALRTGELPDQDTLDEVISKRDKSVQLQIQYRTRQLLYGIETDELFRHTSWGEMFTMMLGN